MARDLRPTGRTIHHRLDAILRREENMTDPAGYRDAVGACGPLTLTATPEAIAFDPASTALIVVDMQNAYASKGGYLDLAGFDVSGTGPVITRTAKAVASARGAGISVVWLQNGWDPAYREAGTPASPNASRACRHPARQGRVGLRAGRRFDPARRRHPHSKGTLQRFPRNDAS